MATRSRWDSLRSKPQSEKNSWRTKPLECGASKPSSLSSSVASTVGAAACLENFQRLQRAYLLSKNADTLKPLTKSIELILNENQSGKELSSCVVDVLLPRLEEIQTRPRELEPHVEIGLLLDSIRISLRNDIVASSLFARSVDEIGIEGLEQQRPNPVGSRLTKCLATELHFSHHHHHETIKCLTDVVRTRARVEGPACSPKRSTFEVDLKFVYAMLEDLLKEGHSHSSKVASVLHLLEAIVPHYTESSPSLFSHVFLPKIIISSSRTVCCCARCGVQLSSLSTWLQTLHQEEFVEPTIYAALVRNTILILENAPLSLWLHETNRSLRTTLSSFGDRVCEGLIAIIRICMCRTYRTTFDVKNLDLAACILRELPYGSSNKLLKEVVDLVNEMARLWRSSVEHHVGLVVDAFVHNMGGQITPQGTLTTMSAPLRHWLLSTSGQKLVEEILMDENSVSNINNIKFMRHTLRTLPMICLRDQPTWNSFIAFLDCCETTKGSSVAGEILQALLQGRRDFDQDMVSLFGNLSESMNDILPKLERWLLSSDVSSTTCSLVSYGLLNPNDWEGLLKNGSYRMHIDLILSICDRDKSSQKVKSEVYKSLGEIATNIIPALVSPSFDGVSEASHLCERICHTFLSALDGNRNVACMAMLGLGNVCQTLSQVDSIQSLPINLLYLIGDSISTHLDTQDGKMCASTIRAMSHVICLVARESSVTDKEPRRDEMIGIVLESLSLKIQQALALGRQELSHLSWKQRSLVKKLGWGACNALATIFSCAQASSFLYCSGPFLVCVENLCLAIVHMQSVNDKVVSAAMGALRSLDHSALGQVAEGKTFLIRAVLALITGLSEQVDPEKAKKVQWERSATLSYLLEICSIADTRQVMDGLSNQNLAHLYDWSIKPQVSAQVMGKIALAMQRCHGLDVLWEQRFASRAQFLLNPDAMMDEL